jgi:hypothetical protein
LLARHWSCLIIRLATAAVEETCSARREGQFWKFDSTFREAKRECDAIKQHYGFNGNINDVRVNLRSVRLGGWFVRFLMARHFFLTVFPSQPKALFTP